MVHLIVYYTQIPFVNKNMRKKRIFFGSGFSRPVVLQWNTYKCNRKTEVFL